MGMQKIKSMQKAANFRKGIIYKEWEHKKLRMEIEDLKNQLETVEKLQVKSHVFIYSIVPPSSSGYDQTSPPYRLSHHPETMPVRTNIPPKPWSLHWFISLRSTHCNSKCCTILSLFQGFDYVSKVMSQIYKTTLYLIKPLNPFLYKDHFPFF